MTHFALRCSQTQLTRFTWAAAVIAAVLTFTSQAEAATLRIGGLKFREESGDFRITGGKLSSDFYTINQEVTGPNVNLLMRIDGLADLYDDEGVTGFRVQSVVTNLTGTPWVFFDHELQERKGRPSPEEDGLSFAQGMNFLRPFTSDKLPHADEITDVRDFINYSGGVVNPGETVRFLYAINDNSPENRFYLLERPNFKPGATGGFVTPPPVTPPPVTLPPVTPPVVLPSPQPSVPPVQASVPPLPISSPTPPVVPPSPPTIPIQPPTIELPPAGNSAAVPEPTTVLGVLAAAGGALWQRGRAKRIRSAAHERVR